MEETKTHIITIPLASRGAETMSLILTVLIDQASDEHKQLYSTVCDRLINLKEINTSQLAAILNEEANNFIANNTDDGRVRTYVVPLIISELIGSNDEAAINQTFNAFRLLNPRKRVGEKIEERTLAPA